MKYLDDVGNFTNNHDIVEILRRGNNGFTTELSCILFESSFNYTKCISIFCVFILAIFFGASGVNILIEKKNSGMLESQLLTYFLCVNTHLIQ